MLARLLVNLKLNFQGVTWQDWLVVAALGLVSLLLVSSLGRVINNARNNYEVYAFEQTGLDQLEDDNEKLLRELAYYESYEYKRLYARENLYLAEPGERLYKLTEPPKLYEVAVRQKDYFANTNFTNWWIKLL